MLWTVLQVCFGVTVVATTLFLVLMLSVMMISVLAGLRDELRGRGAR